MECVSFFCETKGRRAEPTTVDYASCEASEFETARTETEEQLQDVAHTPGLSCTNRRLLERSSTRLPND